MTNKITKKIALEYAIGLIEQDDTLAAVYDPDEIVAKLKSMIVQLDKKNASPKKLTANQEQNLVLRDAVLLFLEMYPNELFTCSDLAKKVPELDGATPQKVSALMSALVKVNKVKRVQDKRKTFFQFAEGDGE